MCLSTALDFRKASPQTSKSMALRPPPWTFLCTVPFTWKQTLKEQHETAWNSCTIPLLEGVQLELPDSLAQHPKLALRLTTFIVLLNFCVLGHFMACFYWYIANGWPTLQPAKSERFGVGSIARYVQIPVKHDETCGYMP